jgi:hypothetical protein
MSKLQAHHVMLDHPEDFDARTYPIASVHPASPTSVALVLAADENSDDGRSNWVWVRLANGDLVLGIYPQGDTYCEVEADAQYREGA